MRLRVRHRLHWEFEEPASMTVQALRLAPHDRAGLTICHWRIAGDRAVPMPGYEDGYGNATLLLTRNHPHRGVTVTVDGEVETAAGNALGGIEETLPPELFCRETLATAADAGVTALLRPGESPAALAARLRGLVAQEADGPVDATQVAASRRASPAGLLHLFLAVTRAGGVPARLVSGYRWPGRNGVEAASTHLWAECWDAAEDAWSSVEVLHAGEVGPGHVRLAVGLDEAEAGPVRGIRRGPGAARFAHSVRVEAT